MENRPVAFVKSIWRILVAVKDGLVLLFLLLFFGLLYMALTLSPSPRAAPVKHGALLLDLNGTIVEQPAEIEPLELLSGGSDRAHEYRLTDLVTAIEAAKDDDNVKAVVLNLDGFMGAGQVALSRVGRALDTVRAAKKPVLAFATVYTDDSYQLASHASEAWLDPFGGVAIAGPGGSRLYYKGLIDKLGVNAHVYRVGTYKSFVEPYTRADQSPEAKEASTALAAALWQDWRDEVAKARPAAKLAAYIDDPVTAAKTNGGDLARAALTSGLVDKLGDERAFEERVAEIAGEGDDDSDTAFAAIDLGRYVKAHRPANDGAIGVLTVAGDIVDGDGGAGMAGGDAIAGLLRDALAERDLKALVVRVDSPGGSVLASEKIRLAIMAAKKEKLPVVVSMGNVAASGGYWISTPADMIFAEPDTITGSIGVFGILPSFEGTLAKIGVTTDGIRTTPLSGQPDLAGGTTPEFDAVMQMGVEDMYRRFLALVAQSRRKTPQQVDAMAQGRVWDGGAARQKGLVDRFGGLEDAVAEAAKRAGLKPGEAGVYRIEKKPGAFAQFIEKMTGGDEAEPAARDMLGRAAEIRQQWAMQVVADLRGMMTGNGIRADCLECRGFGAPRAVSAEDKGLWRLIATLWR